MGLIIGTSGWSYDEWVGPFYDRKEGMFTRYAEVFHTVEINSTFYSYPTAGLIRGLYRSAPPGFVFASKLPHLITHDKWLRLEEGVEDDTERFLSLMRPLAEKLGPILIQLQPRFRYDEHAETLGKYLETLPENFEWVVEFRHGSWMRPETWEMLARHGVAYAIVDEPLLPPETHVTANFAYIRWHGRGSHPWYNYDYKTEELGEWIPRVKEVASKSRKVYGYFNNHFGANAVKNAAEMLTMLDSATPEQTAALRKIVEFKKGRTLPEGLRPLESFTEEKGEEEGLSVADLLMRFTTTSRLQRAEEIGDEELEVKRNAAGRVEARIRDYSIEVNQKNKSIRHDCDDWQKGLDMKRMCKHIDKLFLSLPKEQAKEILITIWEEKDKWRFE